MKTNMVTIVLVSSLIGILATNATCQQAPDKPPHTQIANSKTQFPLGKVETSYVCFVNNKYMGKEQIPVDVGGKVYYGCCMGCVGKLKNNRALRYAKDPLSGKEVDKAKAYIVTKPGGSGEVLYFESKENYNKYAKNN